MARSRAVPVWTLEPKDEKPRYLIGHADRVVAAAPAPSGPFLITASWDGTARHWNVETGQELDRFEVGEVQATAVCFSPSGELIAVGASDGVVRMWRLASQELLWQVLHW